MKNYVEVAYSEKEKPFGPYPLELASYLANRYGLTPGMKLLDNGCGRGEYLHAFAQLGLATFGADLSAFRDNVEVVDFNNQPLPFPNDSFDVVFSKSVLEHIVNTEYFMSEMKRVLRGGGLLY